MDNKKYWLGLAQIKHIGPIRWQKIINYFPELNNFWSASINEICQAGIERKLAEEIVIQRKQINPEAELEKIEKRKIKIITMFDDNYPRMLKEIYGFPPLLFVLGNFNINNDFCLAVVGTRKISNYGKQATQKIVSSLSSAGLTIISGLALGIDACAHQTSLDASGKTIGVLGSGLDQIYPATNRSLAQKMIATGGAVISEFPLGTIPYKSNFPLRNRIISGLSLGTLVIEADIKSGALITAKYALEQNREVFAIPGNIHSTYSQGPNQLIKQGAKMVTEPNDILETLNLHLAKTFKETKDIIPENETEKILLEILQAQELHVDKIIQSSRLNISLVNSTLTVLEMKGLIKNLGGQVYAKAR